MFLHHYYSDTSYSLYSLRELIDVGIVIDVKCKATHYNDYTLHGGQVLPYLEQLVSVTMPVL